MFYKDIERLISERDEKHSLDEWISQCCNDIITKIIAFNLFCEIHYENLERNMIIDIAFKINKHLNKTNKNLDPIDQIKNLISYDFKYLWESPEIDINNMKKISTVIPAVILKEKIMQFIGKSFNRSTYKLIDNQSVEKTIKEFKKHQKEFDKEKIFHGSHKITWFTPTSDLDNLINNKTGDKDIASIIRDAIGLPNEMMFLIEIQYEPDSNNSGHKPTVFHSDFNPLFVPTPNNYSWGHTLNIANLNEGCKEAVRKGSRWPDFNTRLLGIPSLRKKIDPEKWENYFKKREDDFHKWADNRNEFIADMTFFQSQRDDQK